MYIYSSVDDVSKKGRRSLKGSVANRATGQLSYRMSNLYCTCGSRVTVCLDNKYMYVYKHFVGKNNSQGGKYKQCASLAYPGSCMRSRASLCQVSKVPSSMKSRYAILCTDNWRCDQYRWVNQGVKRLPKKHPKVKKSYFHIDTPKGISNDFSRHAYELDPPNKFVLIQYLGDEGAAIDFAHRNKKNDSRVHIRTCPSVLKDLTTECTRSTTSKVHKSAITNLPPTSHISVLQPHNSKQVENIRMKQLQNQRISHDGLYNLHELAIDMPDFIHEIKTHPDLVFICGQKAMLQELDRVLLLDSPIPQLQSYDTTFQLGDFYVSALSFRHTLFKEAPVMPAAFMIHERKFQSAHNELLATCAKLARSLGKTTHPLVVDEGKGIVNAVTTNLPSATCLRCWNHLLRDVKRWLRSHGATSDDVSIYLSDLRELFHQPTMAEYENMLEVATQKWSSPFREYYTNEIAPDIASIARWAIEPHGVYDPYSGVTNNQAESINHVLNSFKNGMRHQ